VTADIQVFSEKNNAVSTFEISMYQNNTKLCNEMFSRGAEKLTPQEYMLKNKTKVALRLLNEKAEDLVVPEYIRKAIQWIRG
jgi:hypothetical protein